VTLSVFYGGVRLTAAWLSAAWLRYHLTLAGEELPVRGETWRRLPIRVKAEGGVWLVTTL